MNAIEVSKISKSYPEFQLNNVSFIVEKGSVTGFIGVNGAGKTTTIKSLLNLIKINSGKIKILGREYEEDEDYIKSHISVVLDNDYFFQKLSMKQMKKIVASSYKDWDEDEYQSYMKRFSLEENMKIEKLSKGMKMKYALALALSHHSELLIMDEPASGLDPLMRLELDNIISDYVKDGEHSVFFSTHVTSDLDRVADSIVFINQGKVVFQKTKENLMEGYGKEINIEDVMINYLKPDENAEAVF